MRKMSVLSPLFGLDGTRSFVGTYAQTIFWFRWDQENHTPEPGFVSHELVKPTFAGLKLLMASASIQMESSP